MNCFNHPDEVSVASCIDCGKGLCRECASLYQMPICNECNLKRVQGDKANTAKVYFPSILLLIVGTIIGMQTNELKGDILGSIGLGFIIAGIPWGWKVITFIQPRMFLFLPLLGWVIYFVIKLFISAFVGVFAMAIGVIKLIISVVSAHSKEKNIRNNLNN